MQDTNLTPMMETPPQAPVEQPKKSNFLTILLSVLLFISISVAGFFAYQTQNLIKELDALKTNEPESIPPMYIEPSSTPGETDGSESDPTLSWKTYINSENGFSIKYPETWRIVEGSFFGTGPKEIREDVMWGVNYYDTNTNSVDKIVDDLGKQFSDRKQVINKVKVGSLNATQVITTTPTIDDWYLETIIFEDADTLFSVSNGAIKDENLQKMVGVPTGTKFENFYSSFRLLN